jgi:hypothetical protein
MIRYCFILFLSVLIISCSKTDTKEFNQRQITKDVWLQKLSELNEWVIRKAEYEDSTNDYLFKNEMVIEAIKRPYVHFSFLKEELVLNNVTMESKVLWIKLSQCISDIDYLDLIEYVLSLKEIKPDEKEKLISNILFPGFEWGGGVSEKYTDPNFSLMLQKVESQYSASNTITGLIKLITNGSNADYLKVHRPIDGPYPRISCEN